MTGHPEIPAPAAGRTARQWHSPRVRRLAGEHGVDLAGVRGSGPAGRVRPQDVLAAAERTSSEPVPAAGHRQVASALVEVDLGPGPGAVAKTEVGSMAAWALLRALRRRPVEGAGGQHLAVLVEGPDGARTVRVLRDAGDLNLAAIRRHLAGPADVPAGPDAPPVALLDGTDTGLLHEFPELPPGVAAVVSVGAVVERPTVVRRDGQLLLAIGAASQLGIGYDPGRVRPATARALLGAVRAELEALCRTTRSG